MPLWWLNGVCGGGGKGPRVWPRWRLNRLIVRPTRRQRRLCLRDVQSHTLTGSEMLSRSFQPASCSSISWLTAGSYQCEFPFSSNLSARLSVCLRCIDSQRCQPWCQCHLSGRMVVFYTHFLLIQEKPHNFERYRLDKRMFPSYNDRNFLLFCFNNFQ